MPLVNRVKGSSFTQAGMFSSLRECRVPKPKTERTTYNIARDMSIRKFPGFPNCSSAAPHKTGSQDLKRLASGVSVISRLSCGVTAGTVVLGPPCKRSVTH